MDSNRTGTQAGVLAGRRILVAGGTGNVGRVVVDSFLAAGARVVVPSRTQDRIDELRRNLRTDPEDRLLPLVGDLGDEDDAIRVRDAVSEVAGRLDGVVASLGRFVHAPSVLSASVADLNRVLNGYLVGHFMVAQTLIPLLEDQSGSYTFINGPLAYAPLSPGAGLVSIATAAQAMLGRVVMKEMSDSPVRINELVLYTPFGWGDADGKGEGAVSQEDVGRFLTTLVSDRGAEVRGQTIHLNSLEPLNAFAGAG